MEMLFKFDRVTAAELSIVLLDWSCRESFRLFKYLSAQSVDREKFEILWVEYYDRRAKGIEAAIRKSQLSGTRSGKVLPLMENPAIKELRLAGPNQVFDDGLLKRPVLRRDFSGWKVSKVRLETMKVGKMPLRKFLPRSVKTYVRSGFRELRRIRSEQ